MKSSYLFFLFSYIFLGNTWANESAFQLTGIIKVNEFRTALIKYRNGDHGYFREGDTFGNGKVLEISKDWIKVGFPNGGENKVYLNGSPTSGDTDFFNTNSEQEMKTLEVGAEYARNALAKAQKKEKINQTSELAGDVNRILGIPVETKIETVEGQPFNSDQMLVKLLRTSLNNGGGTIITVSGMPDGTHSIYLMTHAVPAVEE